MSCDLLEVYPTTMHSMQCSSDQVHWHLKISWRHAWLNTSLRFMAAAARARWQLEDVLAF